MILADQIDALLDHLIQRNPRFLSTEPAHIPELLHPEPVLFRAGKLALQYNADVDLVSLEIAELRGIDQGTPAVLRFWATRAQMRALGNQAHRVAHSGLPIG
jgi:hypothetical protein